MASTKLLRLRLSLPRLASPRFTQCRPHTTSSVDPTEITHFNALASTWWDPHGSSRLLHLMNPLRIRFLQSCLLRGSPPREGEEEGRNRYHNSSNNNNNNNNNNNTGLRYLDVGCGGGILAESLARLKGTGFVVGVDPSKEVVGVAMEHARRDPGLRGKLRYLNTSIEGLGEALGEGDAGAGAGGGGGGGGGGELEKFDVVTLMEVIEHVPHPSHFLTTCMTHVRPGGWLLLSTIARKWTSYITTKLIAEDILNIVPRGTHDWNKYINHDELIWFFKKHKGWGEPVVMGCVYVPGFGWREVRGGEKVGNYFLGVRRDG